MLFSSNATTSALTTPVPVNLDRLAFMFALMAMGIAHRHRAT